MTGGAGPSRPRGARAAALVLAAVGALGAVGVSLLYILTNEGPGFTTNIRLMRATQERLSVLQADLDRLEPGLGAASPQSAGRIVCRIDGGRLLQPAVIRFWAVPAGGLADAAHRVAAAMVEGGWVGSVRPVSERYELSRRRRAWSAEAIVQSATDRQRVYVRAQVSGAEPCVLDG